MIPTYILDYSLQFDLANRGRTCGKCENCLSSTGNIVRGYTPLPARKAFDETFCHCIECLIFRKANMFKLHLCTCKLNTRISGSLDAVVRHLYQHCRCHIVKVIRPWHCELYSESEVRFRWPEELEIVDRDIDFYHLLESDFRAMGSNPLYSFGFKPISRSEFFAQQATDRDREVSALPETQPRQVSKPLGRPKKLVNVGNVLVHPLSSDDDDVVTDPVPAVSQRVGKGKGKADVLYHNWFTPALWPNLHAALKLKRYQVRATVTYLKLRYRIYGKAGPYERLNESTVRGWVDGDKKTLTKKVLNVISTLDLETAKADAKVSRLMHFTHDEMWKGKEHLELEFIELMKSMRAADAGLNSVLIAFQMKAFISIRCPELLRENGGLHSISRSYVRKWVRRKLHWTFRVPTSLASKLPSNWKQLGRQMILKIAYYVFAYFIPEELVINGDQTCMLLMPVGNERTYTLRGSKDVTVSGTGDKRQVSLMMSCSTAGDFLPPHVIFTGKTEQVIPIGPHALLLKHGGWHLTCSESHWSIVDTMKDYVQRIFIPHYLNVCRKLNLEERKQKTILILDCYSVHRAVALREWLTGLYPFIFLIYIPGNYTSRLQPCDIVLQRPFKCAVHRHFGAHAVAELKSQLEAGMSVESLKLRTEIGPLRNLLCQWLFYAYSELSHKKESISSGWRRIGILDAWKKDMQAEAVDLHTTGKLFGNDIDDFIKEEMSDLNEGGYHGDEDVDTLLSGILEANPDIIDVSESEATTVPISELVVQLSTSLHTFFGGPNGRSVNFSSYLTDNNVLTPYE